ncbi:MAG: biotin--[acetyl-CoA-carboxylase] ligase [Gammaproteobacteria bacterium]|nr:biotin--[acetyl-CoA-carboxylase] ligase [Gammaproteobacteria bacterium]
MMNIKPFNKKFVDLVNLLRDGNCHDGNSLGQQLNVTRSAVWKMIKRLEQYGISIHSTRGNGYALTESLILLDPDYIKDAVSYPVELTVLESVDSTNNFLKTQEKKKHMRCCFAEHQTQGRGRLDRRWHSPFGKNIYFSCNYLFQKDVSELAGLSSTISLAILETLRQLNVADEAMVKWPNDVLYKHKKISGVLIDVQAESHGITSAIIGIGLNVNMTNKDIEKSNAVLTQAWTSLQSETNISYDRNLVAVLLIQNLLHYVDRFEHKGFHDFMDEWKACDALANKTIAIEHHGVIIHGEALGINAQGHLLLRKSDGSVHGFSSGDTSMLKK